MSWPAGPSKALLCRWLGLVDPDQLGDVHEGIGQGVGAGVVVVERGTVETGRGADDQTQKKRPGIAVLPGRSPPQGGL